MSPATVPAYGDQDISAKNADTILMSVIRFVATKSPRVHTDEEDPAGD